MTLSRSLWRLVIALTVMLAAVPCVLLVTPLVVAPLADVRPDALCGPAQAPVLPAQAGAPSAQRPPASLESTSLLPGRRVASVGERPGEGLDGLDADQVANAVVIAQTAAMMIEPARTERAVIIGVMTALTESSLRNLGHGDLAGPDSRGLFQQRDGWGPVAVRMNPRGAAKLFYRALLAVPGWSSLPPWRAAQAVQRSAFTHGQNYAASYPIAVRLVAKLTAECLQHSGWNGLGGWGGSNGVDAGVLPGAEAAVRRAYAMVGQTGYYQLCARLAARIWGRTHSGYYSAAEQWQMMRQLGQAHPNERRAPVGALLFWDTAGPYGHVAVYVGGGRVVSNDIGDRTPGQGGVYLVEVTAIEDRWQAAYLGWSPPIYSTSTSAR
jgi:hypothetical protein